MATDSWPIDSGISSSWQAEKPSTSRPPRKATNTSSRRPTAPTSASVSMCHGDRNLFYLKDFQGWFDTTAAKCYNNTEVPPRSPYGIQTSFRAQRADRTLQVRFGFGSLVQ